MSRAWLIAILLVGMALVPVLLARPGTAQAPTISIVSPAVPDVSTLGVRAEVQVQDFVLDQANYGGLAVPGQGHIHYYVDGALAAATWLTILNLGSLAPGAHTIRAELVNNDHSPLNPAVFEEIGVSAVSPSISIDSPQVTAVSTLGFRMQVKIAGLFLDDANYGGTNVPGQGHIHYSVDGALAGATTSTVFDFGALSAGAHTVRAELRNNDHGALGIPVFEELAVTAEDPAIAIVAPGQTTVPTVGFRVEVAVSGLILDEANYGGTNVRGQGHVHYYVDGALVAATTATVRDLGALSSGNHTVRAELRNNDHSALSTPVFDEMTVTAIDPSIAILSPSAAAVSTLGFRMRVTVAGLELDEENYGGTHIAGHGHIHYSVDGALVAATASTVFDFGTLAAGSHTVRAELRNNNHSALSAAVFTEIMLTAAAPSVTAQTSASAISTGQSVVVSWNVVGFIMDSAALGGAPEPGHGHVHVLVDGVYTAATAGDSYELTALAAGDHTIRVELHDNDHSPLAPEVSDEVLVSVTAPPQPTATVDTSVFYGTLAVLLVVIAVLAVLVIRRGRGGRP